VVAELARTGERLDHAVEVAAFGEEEGSRFPTHILTYSTDQIDQILVSEGRLFALTRQKCLHVWDMVSKKRLLSLINIFQFHVEDDCIFAATTTDGFDRSLKVWDFRHQQ